MQVQKFNPAMMSGESNYVANSKGQSSSKDINFGINVLLKCATDINGTRMTTVSDGIKPSLDQISAYLFNKCQGEAKQISKMIQDLESIGSNKIIILINQLEKITKGQISTVSTEPMFRNISSVNKEFKPLTLLSSKNGIFTNTAGRDKLKANQLISVLNQLTPEKVAEIERLPL